MGNTSSKRSGTKADEGQYPLFLKANNINKRSWDKFMLLIYGYMSCVGDEKRNRSRWKQFNFNYAKRDKVGTLIQKMDKAILLMIYNYNGAKITTKREYSRRETAEDSGMVFKQIKNNKQKHSVPGYVHSSPHINAGYKPIIGINNSVKSIKNYEIRCACVHDTVDGQHGHGKKRQAGTVDIHLKAYGNTWDKPLILFLSCYNPVIWNIYATKKVIKNCTIEEIYVSAYYHDVTQVHLHSGLNCDNIIIEDGGEQGYGDDSGGSYGETERMLANIMYEYGDKPLSMIGIYEAMKIDVYVGNKHNFVK